MRGLRIIALLALRNVFRNPWRSLLTLLAVTIGMWSALGLAALARGLSGQMARDAILNMTGHVQAHAPGYLDDPSVERSMPAPAPADLDGAGAARAVSRVRVPAVVFSERSSYGVQLIGIDPAEERGVSFIGSAPVEGRMIGSVDESGIVLGRALAHRLGLTLGKRVVLMSQDVDNRIADMGFRIVGIFASDLESQEKGYVFLGRKVAQDLLNLGDKISEISFMAADEQGVDDLAARAAKALPAAEVKRWTEIQPIVMALVEMQTGFLELWFVVVVVAVSFGLVNTLFMAIFERSRELALMQAIGMKPVSIVFQVLCESALLVFVGVVFGDLLGFGTVLAFRDGLDLSYFAKGTQMLGITHRVFPVIRWGDFAAANLLIALLGSASGLYPAWKAASRDPARVMGR